MVHTIYNKRSVIEVIKGGKTIQISISNNINLPEQNSTDIELDKETLHDFIGLLLHLQSKIKK